MVVDETDRSNMDLSLVEVFHLSLFNLLDGLMGPCEIRRSIPHISKMETWQEKAASKSLCEKSTLQLSDFQMFTFCSFGSEKWSQCMDVEKVLTKNYVDSWW